MAGRSKLTGQLVFFFSVPRNANCTFMTSYDYNHLIAGPGCEKFAKQHGDVIRKAENAFTHFAVARFGEGATNHPVRNKFHKQNERLPPKLTFEDGFPIVGPASEWPTILDDLIDLVRAIFSWHY